jgi:hypothetical protein
MQLARTSQPPAFESFLRGFAMLVASIDALIVPIGDFTRFLGEDVLRGVMVGSACLLALLFLRALTDPACHRAVGEANREMRGQSPFSWRLLPFFDPNWGVFGSRMGRGFLVLVRTLLFIEFVLALVLDGSGRPGEPLLLTATAFGLAIMLSLLQLKEQFPSAHGKAVSLGEFPFGSDPNA